MSNTTKRIESICGEFDIRMEQVGGAIARLELAKALAENEAQLAELKTELEIVRETRKIWERTAEQALSDYRKTSIALDEMRVWAEQACVVLRTVRASHEWTTRRDEILATYPGEQK
jgi:transcription initiation factor TFIIIB Brf1 subunit/transcription initiation factor TFIIB